MTESQIELGRHALGLPNPKLRSYRNHFCAGPTHSDYEDWMRMVQSGDAIRSAGTTLLSGDCVFYLTKDGATACLKSGEQLDMEDF